jgi:polysaccharide biosynthesis transport protein
MDFADLLSALRARWKVELAVFAAVFLAVALWVALAPRVYIANASLLFDETNPGPTGQARSPASLIGTQADIIKSEALAARVVRTLGLLNNPSAVARWRAQTGGTGDPDAWLGRALLANLDVLPGKNSNVLSVTYSASDPQFAALLANSFASAFVDERLKLRIDPAKSDAEWFKDQTASVRAQLEEAQTKLTAFQRARGIVDDGNFNAENSRLAELSRLLANAEAEAAGAQGRARGGSANTSVQESGVVSSLRAEVARKSANLDQMRTVYGPNHPDVIASRAELGALQGKLGAAVGTAMGSLRASTGASSYQEGDLKRLVAAQQDKMLKMSGDRAQLEVLKRDVDSARSAFDSVTQRLAATRLDSQLTRTNVRQLDQARAPVFPSSPRVGLLLFLGTLLGLMLAATIGVLLEWLRPRVRTPEGLARVSGIPVVAQLEFRQSAVMPLVASGSTQ